MKTKDSFTNFIKYEILNYKWNDIYEKILVTSLLFNIGKKVSDDVLIFKIHIFNGGEKILKNLIQKNFNPKNIEIRTLKTFSIITINKKNINIEVNKENENILINNISKSKAYVSGAFLGKGSVTTPKAKFYHFEIGMDTKEKLVNLQNYFDFLGIHLFIRKKKNQYYLYAKKPVIISDILKSFNATNSLIFFEEQRIIKDITSNLKKSEAIEDYNLQKTLQASKNQIDAINKLLQENKIKNLNKDIKRLINLRIENPNLSLSDLNYLYNKKYKTNFSKSTLNNWMKQLIIIAKESD